MSSLISALAMLPTVENALAILIGVFLGAVVGAIPGLTPGVAMVLCTPLTYKMNALPALLLLLSLYCAGTYGGSITAILIRTPGTPAAACTAIDGYPLAQNGQARKALDMALIASVIGGIFSVIVLLICAPQVAKLTVKFSSVEYFMIAVFGISVIISVSGDSLIKGFIAAAIGLLVSTVGVDAQSAVVRYSFGISRLQSGIPLVVVLVGLFGVSELFIKAYHYCAGEHKKLEKISVNKHEAGLRLRDMWAYKKTLLISSLIGVGIGALPGTGAALSSFLAYDAAKRRSPHPETYGKGELDGVCACESANNGVTGATLIPLLTLGVPGDSNVAILLGALTIHSLVPGPQLFQNQGPTIYAMMLGLLVINVVMYFEGKYLIRVFSKVSDIPYPILGGLVGFFCLVGAYACNSSYYSIYIAVIFGLVGFLFHIFNFPVVPLLLGLVLGSMMEQNFRRALVMAQGNYAIFFTRPISLVFFLLTVFSIGLFLYKNHKKKKAEESAS